MCYIHTAVIAVSAGLLSGARKSSTSGNGAHSVSRKVFTLTSGNGITGELGNLAVAMLSIMSIAQAVPSGV